tara:strand:+ start:1151 stop:2083 length:933 start_codon:yes stop_codon:yes gene_type:complete
MFEFPINVVALEGPDCSGKTTLYGKIHKKTDFKWNIRDRSFLSTLCYARQFRRDTHQPRQGLIRELSDLNNRVIVVLPPESIVKDRLRSRGDDFQDERSILELHKIFSEETQNLRSFPNVLVIEDVLGPDEVAEKCVTWLESSENVDPIAVGRSVRDSAISAGGEITAEVTVNFSKFDNFESIMNHPREGSYYSQILSDTIEILKSEFEGNNSYGIPQGLDSRRFYYSSSSCLSSVHFLSRNGLLKVFAQLRSTDVHRNASIDLKFLCHLSSFVANFYNLSSKNIEMLARFNCAHVRNDLEEWTKNEELE